jgi:RNA polymerase sigma-70 factor (ECF subfamily)
MVPEKDTPDDWVRRLKGVGGERDGAIAELTEILIRGLSGSIASRHVSTLQPEDIAQEAVLKILNSLDSFAGRSRFITWAMTIATRTAISELRRKHYKDVSLDAIGPGENLALKIAVYPIAPAEQAVERVRVLRKLRELIESELSEKQKLAVQALLDEMPIEEIARRTGSNRNAVYKLIHDARLRLRAGFERAGMMACDLDAAFA